MTLYTLALLLGLALGVDHRPLAADAWAVRDNAEKRLARAGWRAAPAIYCGLFGTDAEGSERAARLAGRLGWPTWERVAAVLAIYHPAAGWVTRDRAEWFLRGERWRELDRAGRPLLPSPTHTGPWGSEAVAEWGQVAAYANWCRSQVWPGAHGAIPWSASWSLCVGPDWAPGDR